VSEGHEDAELHRSAARLSADYPELDRRLRRSGAVFVLTRLLFGTVCLVASVLLMLNAGPGGIGFLFLACVLLMIGVTEVVSRVPQLVSVLRGGGPRR
jgi:hypothetical protein